MKLSDWKYHRLVPKELRANLDFRRRLREAARTDPATIRSMCRADPLFFLNATCWLYEPRDSSVIPFITYPFQDRDSRTILECVGDQDVTVEKSRDMGATWIICTLLLWAATFHRNMSFLLMSRIADLVDKRDDPKSLFWKLDFQIDRQPHWLKPRWDRKAFHLRNLDMDSVLDGEATTESSTIGDRRTAILADEFREFPNGGYTFMSESRDVTNSRIFNSTPGGVDIAFYKLCRDPKVRKVKMHWTDHPKKSAGLYYTDDPVRGHIDPAWKGKKPRSPWYEAQCDRAAGDWDIAQNLDMDHIGSGSAFFSSQVLETAHNAVRPPMLVGELRFDPETLTPLGFYHNSEGRLKLWLPLSGGGMPPERDGFCGACDVAMGTGASDSAMVVACRQSFEQVAEFADSRIGPQEFARYAVALMMWFHEGMLIWEANGGPGSVFGREVMEAGYRSVYYDVDERRATPKQSDKPGWHTNRQNKFQALAELSRSIGTGAFIPRSEKLVEEAAKYVYLPDGTAEFRETGDSVPDPSGAKANHGDRVMAASLVVKIIRVRRPVVVTSPRIAQNTLAWRMEQAEIEERRKKRRW